MALTTQQKLTAAEDAYHNLVTGQAPRVIVDRDGMRVEYTQADQAKLLAYIQTLKDALDPTRKANLPLSAFF